MEEEVEILVPQEQKPVQKKALPTVSTLLSQPKVSLEPDQTTMFFALNYSLAKQYVAKADKRLQSPALKQAQAQKKLSKKNGKNSTVDNSKKLYCFFDPEEYGTNLKDDAGQSITPLRWLVNLFFASVQGGKEVVDAFNRHGSRINPLGAPKCPEKNTLIAVDQHFFQSGGYSAGTKFPAKSQNAKATVVVTAAYEFENISPKDIIEKKCPFISTGNSNNDSDEFIILNIKINKNNKFEVVAKANTKNASPPAAAEAESQLFLNKTKYIAFIKDKLKRDLNALLYSHTQANKTGPIQVNLNLPGLGYFANLGADPKCSISEDLSPLISEAYFDVLKQISASKKGEPYIAALRVSFPLARHMHDFNKKLAEYNKGEQKFITVKATLKPVDDLSEKLISDSNLEQAVFVAGDPRAMPGNEIGKSSAEPGIFANFVNARKTFSPVLNFFNLQLFKVNSDCQIENDQAQEQQELRDKLFGKNQEDQEHQEHQEKFKLRQKILQQRRPVDKDELDKYVAEYSLKGTENIHHKYKTNKVYRFEHFNEDEKKIEKKLKALLTSDNDEKNYLLIRKKGLLGFNNHWRLYYLNAAGKLVKKNVDKDPALRNIAAQVKDENFADIDKDATQFAVQNYFERDLPPKIDTLYDNETVWFFRFYDELAQEVLSHPDISQDFNTEKNIDELINQYMSFIGNKEKSKEKLQEKTCETFNSLRSKYVSNKANKSQSELQKEYIFHRLEACLYQKLEISPKTDNYSGLSYEVFAKEKDEDLRSILDEAEKNPDKNQFNDSPFARERERVLMRRIMGEKDDNHHADILTAKPGSLINEINGQFKLKSQPHIQIRQAEKGLPYVTVNCDDTAKPQPRTENSFNIFAMDDAKVQADIYYDKDKISLSQAQDIMKLKLKERIIPPVGISYEEYRSELESLASYVVMTGKGYQLIDNHNQVIEDGKPLYFSYAYFPRLENPHTTDYKNFCSPNGVFESQETENLFKEKCKDVIRLQILRTCAMRAEENKANPNNKKLIYLAIPTMSAFLNALSPSEKEKAKNLFAQAIVEIACDKKFIKEVEEQANCNLQQTFGGLLLDDISDIKNQLKTKKNSLLFPVIVSHNADMTALAGENMDVCVCLMGSALNPVGNGALSNRGNFAVEENITRKCLYWVQSLFGKFNQKNLNTKLEEVENLKKYVLTDENIKIISTSGAENTSLAKKAELEKLIKSLEDFDKILIPTYKLTPDLNEHLKKCNFTMTTLTAENWEGKIVSNNKESIKNTAVIDKEVLDQNLSPEFIEALQSYNNIIISKNLTPAQQKRYNLLKVILQDKLLETSENELKPYQNKVLFYADKITPEIKSQNIDYKNKISVTNFKKWADYLPSSEKNSPKTGLSAVVINCFLKFNAEISLSPALPAFKQFKKLKDSKTTPPPVLPPFGPTKKRTEEQNQSSEKPEENKKMDLSQTPAPKKPQLPAVSPELLASYKKLSGEEKESFKTCVLMYNNTTKNIKEKYTNLVTHAFPKVKQNNCSFWCNGSQDVNEKERENLLDLDTNNKPDAAPNHVISL